MQQLFGAISEVFSGREAQENVDKALVFAAWTGCAGEMLRTRAVPLDFFENRLVIGVADETWRRHLEDLSPQMLVKLHESLAHGTVRRIEFRIDAAVRRQVRDAPPVAGRLPVTVAPSVVEAAKAIKDADLRETFLSAAASSLASGDQS